MNKTNIIGLLLMGAVIMLFMYLNQPSAEERAAMAEKARQEQAMSQESDVDPQARLTDTQVTAQEKQIIASTIREFGTKDSTGTYVLDAPAVRLTIAADSTVGGDVTLATGRKVAMTSILTADYGSLPKTEAAEACSLLR